MSIFDWLKRKKSGEQNVQLVIAEGEDEFSGLSLKQVIDAHIAWIDRLKHVLDGTSQEQLKIEDICVDNKCILGKWIYGPAKELYGKLPEYEELRKTHAMFHRCAGDVLQDHQHGQLDNAQRRLRGPFRALSGQIQLDLVGLYARAKNRE